MLLRKTEGKIISVKTVSYALKLDKKEALAILALLEKQGYLQQWGGEDHWIITMRGQVLVHRKFYKSFRPSTMRQHVDDLVKRARLVNASATFPDYVVCLKITSEYPITAAGSGITVALAVDRKNITDDEYEQVADILRVQANVILENISDYTFYPHTAIRKFLKSGSRILKIKEYSISYIKQLNGTVIFEENAKPAKGA